MATAEEILQTMAEVPESAPVCVIDPEIRTIIVPPEYQLFGVENDKRTERLYFQCPKIVGDNQDLSQDYQLFMNYQNANGDPDAYHIEDMVVDGGNITFSWLLEENVTKYRGNIQFAFGAIIPGDEAEDPDKNRWNTTINTDCTCLVGLKCTQQVAESNPDALVQIWAAIDELKAGGGGTGTGGTVDPEQIKQAVNGYLEENPVSGMTAEQEQQLNQNTEDISSLSEEIAKLQTSGLTTAQVNALDGMFKKCAFTGNVSAEYTAFKQAFGIESGGGEEEPTDKTLTSISVTYAGGEVTVGTALTDLTGITVTAHYSDGSTDTITGYTLSGEIVEGKNTITVSYGGKTTTFTVTGVASGGTESNIAYLPVKYEGSEYWTYFPEVVAGDVYYINYDISQYAFLRDFSPWALVSASETTWTYEKYNDNYYKITFATGYGDIGLYSDASWADLEYSTVKYSKNAVPVE